MKEKESNERRYIRTSWNKSYERDGYCKGDNQTDRKFGKLWSY